MRLFAFGCSFTRYRWPTWADILGRDAEYFENWGESGGGNQFIFNSIMECINRNKIKKGDRVCVMWTNVSREDRWTRGRWLCPGNIFTQETYNKTWVKKFADIRGYYIRDMALIYAAERVLSKSGCEYHFFSMVDLDNPDQYQWKPDESIKDVLDLYKKSLDKIKPSMHTEIFNKDWRSRDRAVADDLHPSPCHHLEYIDRVMKFPVRDSTRYWVRTIDQALAVGEDFSNIWTDRRPQRW